VAGFSEMRLTPFIDTDLKSRNSCADVFLWALDQFIVQPCYSYMIVYGITPVIIALEWAGILLILQPRVRE
jgi:hypothetical protein